MKLMLGNWETKIKKYKLCYRRETQQLFTQQFNKPAIFQLQSLIARLFVEIGIQLEESFFIFFCAPFQLHKNHREGEILMNFRNRYSTIFNEKIIFFMILETLLIEVWEVDITPQLFFSKAGVILALNFYCGEQDVCGGPGQPSRYI